MRQNFEFCISPFYKCSPWEKITPGNGGSLKIVKSKILCNKNPEFWGVVCMGQIWNKM